MVMPEGLSVECWTTPHNGELGSCPGCGCKCHSGKRPIPPAVVGIAHSAAARARTLREAQAARRLAQAASGSQARPAAPEPAETPPAGAQDHVRLAVAAAETQLWERLASFGAGPATLRAIGEDQHAARYEKWINERLETP